MVLHFSFACLVLPASKAEIVKTFGRRGHASSRMVEQAPQGRCPVLLAGQETFQAASFPPVQHSTRGRSGFPQCAKSDIHEIGNWRKRLSLLVAMTRSSHLHLCPRSSSALPTGFGLSRQGHEHVWATAAHLAGSQAHPLHTLCDRQGSPSAVNSPVASSSPPGKPSTAPTNPPTTGASDV